MLTVCLECRYCFKGSDQASAAVHAMNGQMAKADQIGRYQDHRYLGAAEAAWRIFAFPIHRSTDHVERMSISLPENR
jgi:hypothetical protein